MANEILDPILRLYDPIRYSFNKKKEYYIIISPTVGSKSQLNDGGRITFEINSYFRCDFKMKDGTQNQVPQTNTTLENNFFPSLFSEMVLEAGSNPIETIKHPGEFDTMLKTVLYPKDFDSVSGWITDVGDGSFLKEPVRNLANDADLDRVRVVARNTIESVARAANHGFEKRVLQYNNVVENNRDDIDLERIDANVKKGGFIFSLPSLIFAGITAAATVAGATAGGVSVSNEKKAAIAEAAATKAAEEKKAAEEHRHNSKMEKLAAEVKKPKTEKKCSGVGDMIGTMKEFGKRFSEETKKTVKQGLNKLVDSIDTGEIKVKHKGNGIF
ncbi:hypothetical protein LOTGIDRAFT_161041 [Lottia gigantea]|uniref:Uncharacterized protein n=1 Tax=Lottia gigantea TaxID=225164 RepID=V4AHW1_LOTGI|nr:hypothetical protein LOTGIDRAFT_161041 [Lottia gigantea]ESO94790.1 hypothetical protein LOTGIDRAFT_161041 [Lottia gigantea]